MGRKTTFFDKEFNRPGYDALDSGRFERDKVFVIMPFSGKEMSNVYSVIKDECKKLGLNSVRADELLGSRNIIKNITYLIERAEFLIIDLTYERPNVYYELGYAHGVGNEDWDILLIAKEHTELHFDIFSLKVYFYSSTDDLKYIIPDNLKEMIRKTRGERDV